MTEDRQELTPEMKAKLDKLAERLRNNPKLAERTLEHLAEQEAGEAAEKPQDGEQAADTAEDVPYGYRLADDGVRLIEDDEEQDVLRQIRELRDGGASYRAIVCELSDRGISTRTGGAWNPGTIKRLCAA